MKQLTLNISDNQYHVFLEFIKTLDYVQVPEADEQTLDELQSSFNQVKLMQEGKIDKQNIQEFIDEL